MSGPATHSEIPRGLLKSEAPPLPRLSGFDDPVWAQLVPEQLVAEITKLNRRLAKVSITMLNIQICQADWTSTSISCSLRTNEV